MKQWQQRILVIIHLACCLTLAQGSPVNRTLDLSPAALRPDPVPEAMFGANIGYWSVVNGPALAASAQEAGLTVFRYHPGTYSDPHTVPGSINQWDFTAVDAFGAQRLADFGKFLIETGTTGQIHINYGAGSPAQAAALLAYLRVPIDAAAEILNLSLGSAVLEPSIISPYTRTRDWRTVGFWANLRASAPLAVDDGFNKLRLSHPAPFPVLYFECGNEADYSFVPCLRHRLPGENSITQGATGFGGRRADAHTYANFYATTKALLQQIDPAIRFGASAGYFEQANNDTDSPAVPYLFPGPSGTTKAWTPVVLTRLRELGVTPDFIIAHRYTQQTDFAWNNNYLLRGALNAYLAPGQGTIPRIHVTEINWAENESVPYTTTIHNAVNLGRSFADALQHDVENLSWFTFTSGSTNYNASSTTGWRKYHNWGLIADDPLAGQTPSTTPLSWPGMFPGVRFPVFHAFALLKEFARPGDFIYQASALSPANINSHDVTVFAVRRASGDLTFLVLNKADATHSLNLTLANSDLSNHQNTLLGSRYGKAQDEEQRLKSLQSTPLLTNNTRETFTIARNQNLIAYDVPPLSVTVLTLPEPPLVAPTITSAQGIEAVKGLALAHPFTASGGAVTFSAATLPAGLSFDPTTAQLTGTPTQAGDFTIQITATNPQGQDEMDFHLAVRDRITATAYSQNFTNPAPGTLDWWSYAGDGGVSSTFTRGAFGPGGAQALRHQVAVTAPPAAYWYAGMGTNIARPEGFALATLADFTIRMNVWSGLSTESPFDIILKSANNQELTHRITIPGQTWTEIEFPLSAATNHHFDFNASHPDLMLTPWTGAWPLASTEYRLTSVQVQRSTAQDTPAQAWRRTHFASILPIGAAADIADPDGDGFANLLEYALGGHPLTAETQPLVRIGMPNQNAAISFSRIADPGLIYEILTSENLSQWNAMPMWSSTGMENTAGPITVTDTETTSFTGKKFYRVRIRKP